MPWLISGGTVYDPANGVAGAVRDLWIQDGQIVAPDISPPERTLDAAGLIVMPGGVDMHSHIAGPKVNAARRLRPDDRRDAATLRKSAISRSGTAGSVPSTFATGMMYAGLGYTTAVDAAIAPLGARHAHFEFADTPNIDKAMLLSLGDHQYALECLAAGESARFRDFIAWQLKATQAYGVKLVNAGGIESYKRGHMIHGIDEPVAAYQLTARTILASFADAIAELGLPHPPHIHCADLGRPGNWTTTLASMQALDGRAGHFTHIQFHSYGGGPDDPDGFCARVEPLAEYVNSHPEITVDVGQVLFGGTTAMTGDSAVGHFLHRATGRRWIDADTECEAGCGIIPVEYRRNSLVHALQWAIGLEWFLLIRDPWRIGLTTDHPNGATFTRYPEIIELLMRRDARLEVLGRLPSAVRQRSRLAELEREYTMVEIAIITRAAPARILGLPHKGHLGVGADADVTIYQPNANLRAMFTLPRYVVKAGELLVENGEPRSAPRGVTLAVEPATEPADDHWRRWFEAHYSLRFGNFGVPADALEGGRRLVQCRSPHRP